MTGMPNARRNPRLDASLASVSTRVVVASWPAWMLPPDDRDVDPPATTSPTPKVKKPDAIWPSAADSDRQSIVYSPSPGRVTGATSV